MVSRFETETETSLVSNFETETFGYVKKTTFFQFYNRTNIIRTNATWKSEISIKYCPAKLGEKQVFLFVEKEQMAA